MKEKQWTLLRQICGVVAVALVATFFCLLSYQITYAWFYYEGSTDDSLVVGYVGVEVYSNGTKIAKGISKANAGYSNATALNTCATVTGTGEGIISIKNTGNIPVLLRVTAYSVKFINENVTDEDNNPTGEDSEVLLDSDVVVAYGSDWIRYPSADTDNTNVGEYIYNAQVNAGAEITFISAYTVNQVYTDCTLSIMLQAEVIQYQSNPYSTETRVDGNYIWGEKTTLDSMGWTAYKED